MEVLVISDGKLKVMLEKEDMKKYGLDAEQMNYEDPKTRKKLMRVLDEVKERSGFDATAEKLLIQLYPSRDGGSEMFVTKLGLLSSAAEQSLRRSRGVGVFMRGTEIYFTDAFESLLGMARIAEGLRYIDRSLLYYEEGVGYYLVLEQRCGGGSLSPLLPLLEYGDQLSPERLSYIEEYATLLLDTNAIGALAALCV